jgi:hypothetical protein
MKASFFFIKYKKIQAPFEILKKSVDFGWKCRKYARWTEVHASEESYKLLRSVGDSLINSNVLPRNSYEEISNIFCKVLSWSVNKEYPNYDLMPEMLLEYEKFERAVVNGSLKPGIVDNFLINKQIFLDVIPPDERWTLYASLQIKSYFLATNRFLDNFPNLVLNQNSPVSDAGQLIREILGSYCFTSEELKFDDQKLICLFLKNLDLDSTPKNITREETISRNLIPRVVISHISSDKSIFVKFELIEGQLIIKLNNNHHALNSSNKLFEIYKLDDYWILIGETLYSNLGKIHEIEKFYTSLGLKISEYE